jgi:iron complex outermembrane receptor protein
MNPEPCLFPGNNSRSIPIPHRHALHRASHGLCISLLALAAVPSWAEAPKPAAVSASASATTPAEPTLSTLSLDDLMRVQVTSVTRQESTVGESPAAIFVITQEMIHRSGATSIPEILRMAPGVNVARSDANQWVISIRGFDNALANKLLVQIDGRTLYSPIQAGVFWDSVDYPLEDIERIEVVRGPGGTVWGANAVNGVINIITKTAKETQGVLVSGGGGSEERGFATVRFGGKLSDNLHYRAYGKWFERDSSFSVIDLAHDDWRSGRAGFRVDWTPATSDTVTFQGDWFSVTSGRSSIDGLTRLISASDTETRGGDVLARWTHELGAGSNWQVQAYWDRSQQITGAGGLKFAADTFDVDFQQQFPIGDRQKFIYGLGYRLQKVLVHGLVSGVGLAQSGIPRIDDEPTTLSAFVQDEIKLIDGKLYVTLGSKFEMNDFSGFEYQPSARLLWTPTKSQSVWASVSRAVRTPDVLEDAFAVRAAGVNLLVPNRDLAAEEVIAYELGYRAQVTARFALDAALFFNKYDRLSVINNLPVPAGSFIAPLQFTNGMDGDVYGAEITATWAPTDWWRIQGAYSYLQLELHADQKLALAMRAGAELPELQSPQNHVYVRSSLDLPGRFQLDLIGRYVDNLPGFTSSIKTYITMDARLAWKATENLELAVVGQNLLDGHHPENGGTALVAPIEVERGVYGTATYRW